MASGHLAAGKIGLLKNSALSYQDGALFFVHKDSDHKGYYRTYHGDKTK